MTTSSAGLRQVPFPSYLEFQATRILPLAARVAFVAAVFVPVFMVYDAACTGGTGVFGALVAARLATLGFGVAGGLVAWYGRRPRPTLVALIACGALSQNCATGAQVFLLHQVDTIVAVLVFYFLSFVLLAPVLSRTVTLAFLGMVVASLAGLVATARAAGVPVSDREATQLFQFVVPCLAFIGLMMEHLRFAAVEAYRHARNDHLHLSLDSLSQLLNRPTWMARAEARWRRDGTAAGTVLMVDIDHFKAVNDTHGHDAGDRVIEAVAGVLLAQTRDADLVGRLGGEEFAVLVEGGQDVARQVAERIRAGVAALAPASGPVSVSVGVAEAAPTLDQAVKAADGWLYDAKTAGRNRVSGPGNI
jgi:diguanylate cyclase (GGDEF)-like protein